jgi:hypothetical protein
MEFGDYKIESDELNVTVYKRQITNKGENEGKVYWTPEAYFSNFTNALKWLVDLHVKLTGLKSFEQVVAEQSRLHKMIEELKL